MINFNDLIGNFIARKFKPKQIGRYYPSEIGGCLRKTWFSYKNPKEPDINLLKVFQAGDMMHDFLTEVIKSKKNKDIELIEAEMPIKVIREKFVISGRVDNLILLKIEGKKVLVEVKSTKFLPEEPRLENIMQLQFYMYATKVWDGMLVYIQKDNLHTKSFPIRCRKETAKKIMQRFEDLHYALSENEIPKAEANLNEKKKWMCDYCDWKSECDNNLV